MKFSINNYPDRDNPHIDDRHRDWPRSRHSISPLVKIPIAQRAPRTPNHHRRKQTVGYARDALEFMKPRDLIDVVAYAAGTSAVAATLVLAVTIPAIGQQGQDARTSRSVAEQIYHLDQQHTDKIAAVLAGISEAGALSVVVAAVRAEKQREQQELGGRLQFPEIQAGAPPNPPGDFSFVMGSEENRKQLTVTLTGGF
jgi:aerobic-type carbon monoxide dehydrogenase small subunit (CoxS/CutS family)